MSGQATIDTAVRATKLGAIHFLEKPLSTDALLITVETALRLDRAEAEARALRARDRDDGGHRRGVARDEEARRARRRAAKSAASVLVTGERGRARSSSRGQSTTCRPGEGPAREAQLRGRPGRAHRERALRARGGRLHGRDEAAAGEVRARERGHALPRRGRRHAARRCRPSCCASCRSARSSGRGEREHQGRRARRRRDQPGLVAGLREGAVPRRSLRPPQRRAARHPPAPRAPRRHPLPRAPFPRPGGASANDRPHMEITDAAVDVLTSYSFPGNVRELRNLIERLVILTPGESIGEDDVRNSLPGAAAPRQAGLYRAGVPFRVLTEEAERTILQEASPTTEGRWRRRARARPREEPPLQEGEGARAARGQGGREGGGGGVNPWRWSLTRALLPNPPNPTFPPRNRKCAGLHSPTPRPPRRDCAPRSVGSLLGQGTGRAEGGRIAEGSS